jgi:SAM-dependent methyltransferase
MSPPRAATPRVRSRQLVRVYGPDVLLTLDDIRSLLVCPRCRSKLTAAEPSGLSCEGCQASYPITVSGQPILVDFGSSILDREESLARGYESAMARPRGRANQHPDVHRNLNLFRSLLPAGATVLVVGGGVNEHGLDLYDDPDVRVVCFDLYASDLTQFIADGHRIPLPDGVVDAVLVQAVLEHVLDPWRVVEEVHRVLVPDGLVYAETPFLQQVHEGPYDFHRFTDSGHRWLFRRFAHIESGPVGGPGLQTMWAIDYLIRGITRSRRAGSRSRRLTRLLQRLDRRVPRPHRIDSSAAVYFLGRRSERCLTPKEMVAYYQGAQQSATVVPAVLNDRAVATPPAERLSTQLRVEI